MKNSKKPWNQKRSKVCTTLGNKDVKKIKSCKRLIQVVLLVDVTLVMMDHTIISTSF